mgnify:CR=1 FL=1
MKILHVITSLRTGGAEKLMVDLLPRLKSMGHEVDLCVFDGIKTPFYQELENTGIKIIPLRQNGSVYDLRNVFALIPIIKNYDVVHTHNTACQMYVAFANVFVRKRIVTTEHSTSNRRRNYPILKWIDKWVYRQYETIVTVSDIAGQNIEDYIGDNSLPIKTILNGIDVQKYRHAAPCRELVEAYKDCFLGIMVAGFRYEKDHVTAIKAYSYMPEHYHLLLVGDGEKRAECEALVKSLGLQDRIHFLGIRLDVPNLLKAADVVIMSSHREGFGLSVVEGMAAEKPCIASDVEGLHDIVCGYGFLFAHENASELSAAIIKFCNDQECAKEVAARCLERAMQFDIEKMLESYNQIYHLKK